MPRRIEHGEETLETLIARKEQLQSSYKEVQEELSKRKKTILNIEQRIEEEKEHIYLHNLRELAEIVLKNFGEKFSQTECKEMLEHIFEIDEVKRFVKSEKGQLEVKELNSVESALVEEQEISSTENISVDLEKYSA